MKAASTVDIASDVAPKRCPRSRDHTTSWMSPAPPETRNAMARTRSTQAARGACRPCVLRRSSSTRRRSRRAALARSAIREGTRPPARPASRKRPRTVRGTETAGQGESAGRGRGWDRGTWTPEGPDVDGALRKGELTFALHGQKLKGSWVLVRTRSAPGGGRAGWLLIKHRDAAASTEDVTLTAPRSAVSGR